MELDAGRYLVEVAGHRESAGSPDPAVTLPAGCAANSPAEVTRWSEGAAYRVEFACDAGIAGLPFRLTGTDARAPVHAEFQRLDGQLRSEIFAAGTTAIVAPGGPPLGAVAGGAFARAGLRLVTDPGFWALAILFPGLFRTRRKTLEGGLAFAAGWIVSHFLALREVVAVAPELATSLALILALGVTVVTRSVRADTADLPASPLSPAPLFLAGFGALFAASTSPPVAGAGGSGSYLIPLAGGVAAALVAMGILWIGGRLAANRTLASRGPLSRPGLVLGAGVGSAALIIAARFAATMPAAALAAGVELAVAAATLGLAAAATRSRGAAATFVLLFALGTGLDPAFIDSAYLRLVALGILGLLAVRVASARAAHAGLAGFVTIAAPLVLGAYLRSVGYPVVAFPAAALAGAALAGTLIFLAGQATGARIAPDELARTARAAAVCVVAVAVLTRSAEYLTGAAAWLADDPSGRAIPPIPLLALALLAAAILFRPRERTVARSLGLARRPRRAHLAAGALAFLLLPVGMVRPGGPAGGADLGGAASAGTIADLLTNTYHAFNLDDEMELYDQLSRSVAESLVPDLFLDSRRRFAAGTANGDEVTIERVTLHEIEPIDEDRAGGVEPEFTARWSVLARVRHLRHVHHRENVYSGTIRLRMEDDRWKLAGLALTGEDRVIAAVGSP